MGEVDAVVVGAGFSGLYMLHRLRQLGMTTRGYEAASDVGGTWYWNRYPGARCDITSVDYSYSFSPELEQEWEWTERYATQPEILRYANHVADRFDLRRDIQFETRVTHASFEEATGQWAVVTDRGEHAQARFLILGVGCLSVPKQPEIAGIDHFRGRWYHTGQWPHEGVDFTGQRVGVIGTGSSGIQAIPLIARQADQVRVFQRTANFSVPARNGPLDSEAVAELKANYPEYRQRARESAIGVPLDHPTELAVAADPAEREARYAAAWDSGTLYGLPSTYVDVLRDEAANDTAAEFARARIRDLVDDPAVAETLSPRGYPIGAKRICVDTDYYATFNRDNVTLVDLRTTPIVEITESGVRTTEREHDCDSLVFATGFDAMTGPLLAVDLRGRGGRALRDRWDAGPRTYLGVAVAGFPNMFLIAGPGSPSVLSNMILSIEQHVEWIADCLAFMDEQGVETIEPTDAAEDFWVDHVNIVGAMTLFPRADSWYVGANVPGKPRVFMPYVGGVGAYREICAGVAAKGYEGFALDGEPGAPFTGAAVAEAFAAR